MGAGQHHSHCNLYRELKRECDCLLLFRAGYGLWLRFLLYHPKEAFKVLRPASSQIKCRVLWHHLVMISKKINVTIRNKNMVFISKPKNLEKKKLLLRIK